MQYRFNTLAYLPASHLMSALKLITPNAGFEVNPLWNAGAVLPHAARCLIRTDNLGVCGRKIYHS